MPEILMLCYDRLDVIENNMHDILLQLNLLQK